MLTTSHLIPTARLDRFQVMADRLRRANAAVYALPESASGRAERRSCDKHRSIYERALSTRPRSIGEVESKLNIILEYAEQLGMKGDEIENMVLTLDDLRTLRSDLHKIIMEGHRNV